MVLDLLVSRYNYTIRLPRRRTLIARVEVINNAHAAMLMLVLLRLISFSLNTEHTRAPD